MSDNKNQMIDGRLEAADRLPPDMMLLKMENESIMALARTAPRDPMKIIKQLGELIEAYPAAADEAVYSKPVGTVLEVTCGNPKCGVKYEVAKIEGDTACPNCESEARQETRKIKKFAEGLSIRAAESIRSVFGYTRLAVTAELLPDDKVKLTGVLVDYAAGNVTSDTRIVSPYYKSRAGRMVKTPEDRFLNVVVKAEKSKLRRDVILDSTPGIVKAMFRDMCDQKLTALVSTELIEQKIIPAFESYGITREQLDKLVGRPFRLGWTEEDRLSLRKILTALKNEETTVAELLADLYDREDDEGNGASSSGNGPVNAGDLMQPAAKTATNGRTPTTETPSTGAAKNGGSAPAAAGPEAAATSQAPTEPLAAFADRLAACRQLGEVNALEEELIRRFQTDAQRAEVAGRCQERRDQIKSGRQKKPGQLGGA